MKDLYLHHHLGLGDMIHCNGMVRALLEARGPGCKIFVFCKNRHLKLAARMYRDQPRIHLLGVPGGKQELSQVDRLVAARRAEKRDGIDFLRVGHRAYGPTKRLNPNRSEPWTCDMIFYRQLEMPYEWRYTKCHWEREPEEELRVYRKLAPPGGEYVFVHDDPARGHRISAAQVNTRLPIVRNDLSESIFDLGLLLERAREVHVMESSIRCLLESLDTKNTKLFLYRFRGGPRYSAKEKRWVGTCKQWEIR